MPDSWFRRLRHCLAHLLGWPGPNVRHLIARRLLAVQVIHVLDGLVGMPAAVATDASNWVAGRIATVRVARVVAGMPDGDDDEAIVAIAAAILAGAAGWEGQNES
jgi:hypothetical protein